METTGKQTSLSSAVAVRDRDRGCKAKNRTHVGSLAEGASQDRYALTQVNLQLQALWALLYGIIPGAPSVSNRVIQSKQPGDSQMHRLVSTYSGLFSQTHLHDSSTWLLCNSQSAAPPGTDSQQLTHGVLKDGEA